MSKLFINTLREDPSDAEVRSSKYLIRAGYIRKIAAGIYTWLPLGLRVLKKVEDIIRREMNIIGGQEILLPALLPAKPFSISGRLNKYGAELFRLKDRKNTQLILGPTHEEFFTILAKNEITSHKTFPQIIYQIQHKYRDEERPRAGILRGREFIMKDSYSFDLSLTAMQKSYLQHKQAYHKIFTQLGIKYVAVKAFSGAMGGEISEEFLAISDIGEDTFVKSTTSDYAANIEAVETQIPVAIDSSNFPATTKVRTPAANTINLLLKWLKNNNFSELDATNILKSIIFKISTAPDNWKIIGVGIPGDREIDLKRLAASLGVMDLIPLSDNEFKDYNFLCKGYIGPQALLANNIEYYLDTSIAMGSKWITGANELDYHYFDVVVGRDFIPTARVAAIEVKNGDLAFDGTILHQEKGIEIGQIFQLGTYYSEKFNFKILDELGIAKTVFMGSYGIGVTRLIGVVAEQQSDELGLIWPESISPYDVHLVVAIKDEEIMTAALQLAETLSKRGLDILLDDRKISSGIKFKDAELIGIPKIIVIGKNWRFGNIEYKERKSGTRKHLTPEQLINILLPETD